MNVYQVRIGNDVQKITCLRLLNIIREKRLVLGFIDKICPARGHLGIGDSPVLQLKFKICVNSKEKDVKPTVL